MQLYHEGKLDKKDWFFRSSIDTSSDLQPGRQEGQMKRTRFVDVSRQSSRELRFGRPNPRPTPVLPWAKAGKWSSGCSCRRRAPTTCTTRSPCGGWCTRSRWSLPRTSWAASWGTPPLLRRILSSWRRPNTSGTPRSYCGAKRTNVHYYHHRWCTSSRFRWNTQWRLFVQTPSRHESLTTSLAARPVGYSLQRALKDCWVLVL